jgi:uncharacterized membrane protein
MIDGLITQSLANMPSFFSSTTIIIGGLFALLAWFFSPVALLGATAFVVAILYSREFHSDVLNVLND